MNFPLISVIVPIYNVETYLTKCLDSILAQDYKNFELILVDDGSTDQCGIICDEYKKKEERIVVVHKQNGGLSDARNAGLEICKGEYITFIDSDDFISFDYVSYLYYLINDFSADISVCGIYNVRNSKPKENRINNKKPFILNGLDATENMLYSKDFDVSACAKMYSRYLWNDLRFPKGKLHEDNAFTYRVMLLAKTVAISREPKYYYVIRNNSIMTNHFSAKYMDMITAVKEVFSYAENNNISLVPAATRRLVFGCFNVLKTMGKDYQRYPEICTELLSIIKTHRKEVLLDSNVIIRDKVAIISISMGLRTFFFIWNIYSILTNRKI